MDENIQPEEPQLSPAETPAEAAAPGKPPSVLSTSEGRVNFAVGFVLWFVVNGLFWYLGKTGPSTMDSSDAAFIIYNGACVFPINVLVLVISLVKRPWRAFGFGLLAAWGVNLVVSLVLSATANAFCLVPFFIK